MKLKKGVIIEGVSPHIWYAIAYASFLRPGQVVTSLRDGSHRADSLHYSGKAADLRTRDHPAEANKAFLAALRGHLEPLGFDVVDEMAKPGAPHIHVEWDPKPGETFFEFVV